MILRERKRNRLKKYDYSNSGWYFVTICVKKHECVFGKIEIRKMILNEYGNIVNNFIHNIPNRYKNIDMDEFIIMPNHVHMILIIHNVGTIHELSLRRNMLLPKIIGYFKMNTSKLIHQLGFNSFRWQRSYYDHIIRNEQSLWSISQYIRDNSKHWEDDINNVENLDI